MQADMKLISVNVGVPRAVFKDAPFAQAVRKQACDLIINGDKFVKSDHVFVSICFSAVLFVSGCSSVGGDVQAGRNALQTRRANDAVGYLARAADIDPNYRLPYRVPPGVLALLGRAYLETGRDKEARQTLEKAVNVDRDDPFAHLYLGIAMLKTGDRERGRQEIEAGLKMIDDTLEYFSEDRVYGIFWDPGMQIRNDIRTSLAAKLDDAQLIMAGEYIGRQFDEEIDKARRDQARGRGGSDSGGSGGGN
jgi:tetratricopeptide (TPR) repeat protein